MNFYFTFILSFIAGFFYAIGFPTAFGISFFLGPLIGFFLFNYCLSTTFLLKKQLLIALFFSMGFYLFGFYWIPETLKEFGGLFFPINQILGLLFSLFIIPQVYIYVFLKRKISTPLFLSLIYVLLEEFTPQQFPAHLGHSVLSLIPNIPLRLAPFFGAPVYSFLTAFLALNILNHLKLKKRPTLNYALCLLMLVLNFTLPAPEKTSRPTSLNLRIVQPNIGNFLKIDSERGGLNSLQSVFDNYYTLSTAPSEKPLDLIIWPETSFPTLIVSSVMKKNNDLKIPGPLTQIIEKTQAELFIGGYDLKPLIKGEDYQDQYNAAFHFGSDGKLKNVYHKIRLIPFGEGLPFGPFNKFLSKIITNISYFAEGDNYTLFKTQKQIPFISVICYEILFADFLRDFLNAHENENENKDIPQFLVNLTNDSWYGNTAELSQHLFLAKWRAIEFNIPIIRSTNTGITTVVMPDATESNRLNYQEKKVLDIELMLNKRTATLYQKFGLWMTIGLAFLFWLIRNHCGAILKKSRVRPSQI